MIDGLFKSKIDLIWNKIGIILVKLRMTPNMVTLSGLALVILSSLYFILFKNSLIFGILLAFCLTTDALDGAVARISKNATKFGSYMDAVIDRYQEIIIYFSIAYSKGYWLSAFLAITGSMLVSYNKARVAVEIPISNNDWPDLLERLERLILIIIGLIADGIFSGNDILLYFVAGIAILSHFTAVQRFFRARKMLNGN